MLSTASPIELSVTLRALLFEEQRFFRRLPLDDPLRAARQRVAVEAVPVQRSCAPRLMASARDVFIARRADDEDPDVRRRSPNLVEGREPVAVRQMQIELAIAAIPLLAQPCEPVDELRHALDDEDAVPDIVGERRANRPAIRSGPWPISRMRIGFALIGAPALVSVVTPRVYGCRRRRCPIEHSRSADSAESESRTAGMC